MNFSAKTNKEEGASMDDLRVNDAVFEAFFKQHYPRLCVYCKFKYNFDIELAEDVISTSFIKLWEVRHMLADDIFPTSYLYKIIDNRCLNILKHNMVKRKHVHYLLRTSPEGISQATFDSIDLKQLRTAIEVALAELPEQMRKIFELSRVEDLKYSEIAGRLNISVKTVETQISRALAKLREKLSEFMLFIFIFLIFSCLMKG